MRILDTALGSIQFSAHATAVSGGEFEVEYRVLEVEPTLPPGMTVRRVRAVLVRATSTKGLERLEYRCRFGTDINGGAESGQSLDAQLWEGDHDVVMIGTEDGESLAHRLPWFNPSGDPLGLVQYQKDGLAIPLANIPRETGVSLHFIVAENPNPEPTESSAWYAVDIPHAQLWRPGS